MSAVTLRHPEFILLSARGFLDPTQELGCEGLWQRDSVFSRRRTLESGIRRTDWEKKGPVERVLPLLKVIRNAAAVLRILPQTALPSLFSIPTGLNCRQGSRGLQRGCSRVKVAFLRITGGVYQSYDFGSSAPLLL